MPPLQWLRKDKYTITFPSTSKNICSWFFDLSWYIFRVFFFNYVCVCVCVCTTGGGRLFPPTQVFRLLPSELSHLLQGNPLFHSHSLLSSLSEVNNSLHTLSISCSAWGRSSPNNWRQLCKSLYFPAFTASKCIDRLLGVSFSHEDSRNCRFAIS